MKKLAFAAAFSTLVIIGAAGTPRAESPGCNWAGNHWDCGDHHVYPKWYYSYPSSVVTQPSEPTGRPSPDYYGPRPY